MGFWKKGYRCCFPYWISNSVGLPPAYSNLVYWIWRVKAKDRPSSYRGKGVDRVLDADEWKVEERVQMVPEIPPLTLWSQQTSIFSSYPTNVEWQTTCQERCYLMEVLCQIGYGSVFYELLLSSYLWSNFQFSKSSVRVMGKFRAERTLRNYFTFSLDLE